METFDLTTKDGMEIAKKYFELTPVGMLFKIGKMIFDSDSVKKQGKTVEDLIKAGKERGGDEMEIILDKIRRDSILMPQLMKVLKLTQCWDLMKKLKYE